MAYRLVTARRLILLASAVVGLLPAVGCGSGGGHVTGTFVHQDGTPLVGARVIARSPSTGQSAVGLTDDQGHFELKSAGSSDGIPPGDYYVIISENLGDENYPLPSTIARKYSSSSRSGMQVSVQPGETVVLDMTLDPP